MENKLKTKDLITAGIFGAMYLVVLMVTVTLVGFIPITYILAPFFVGITCAPVYLLYVMKVRKMGAVFILSVLVALLISSASVVAGAWAVLCGLIAEGIIRIGMYQSKKHFAASFLVFACSTVGPFLLILFMKNSYLTLTAKYYGQEYADTLNALTPPLIIIVLIMLAIVGGLIGTRFAYRILKKHFEKAGVV